MNNKINNLGANATVYLEFEGGLEELGVIISKSLHLPKFWIDTDQNSPHNLTAYNECLGFELFLYSSNKIKGYNYTFEMISTTLTVSPIETTPYDLSSWYLDYFNKICEIKAKINTS